MGRRSALPGNLPAGKPAANYTFGGPWRDGERAPITKADTNFAHNELALRRWLLKGPHIRAQLDALLAMRPVDDLPPVRIGHGALVTMLEPLVERGSLLMATAGGADHRAHAIDCEDWAWEVAYALEDFDARLRPWFFTLGYRHAVRLGRMIHGSVDPSSTSAEAYLSAALKGLSQAISGALPATPAAALSYWIALGEFSRAVEGAWGGAELDSLVDRWAIDRDLDQPRLGIGLSGGRARQQRRGDRINYYVARSLDFRVGGMSISEADSTASNEHVSAGDIGVYRKRVRDHRGRHRSGGPAAASPVPVPAPLEVRLHAGDRYRVHAWTWDPPIWTVGVLTWCLGAQEHLPTSDPHASAMLEQLRLAQDAAQSRSMPPDLVACAADYLMRTLEGLREVQGTTEAWVAA
jgi:hypothetical protein